jgi:hypothetical protein
VGEPSDEAFDLACEIVHGNAGPGNAAKMIDEALQAAELRGAEKMRDAAIIAVRGSNADLYKSAVAAYQAAVSSIRILDPSVIVKDQSNG